MSIKLPRKLRYEEADYYDIIRENIKQIRRYYGWTQLDLSEEAEVSKSLVGFIEQKRAFPTIGTLLNIAAALGVQPSLLLTRNGYCKITGVR